MIYEPAIVALESIDKIMDKYEPKHNGAWTKQTMAHHATHAIDHINDFAGALGRGDKLTPENIEDVVSCMTRCAFILANIKRGDPALLEAAPALMVPGVNLTLPSTTDDGNLLND